VPAQLIALAAALSYAISGIAAKRGLRYSTPITVTLISVAIHAALLWTALLMFRGVPMISWWVLFLFVLSGLMQPVLRFLTYAGIHYVGAAAGTTLRGAHPLFSTTLAVIFLGESWNLLIVLGTISIVAGVALISWQGNKKQEGFQWWHLA
jgi:drug/metabolite transporter (DMT)-like permease